MDMQKNMGRRRILGRALAAAATLALALGLSACGGAPAAGSDAQAGSESQRETKTVVFTDSAGREVEVPANIERVVPSGHTATQVLITLVPEKLAGLPQEITQDQRAYLTDAPDESLPVLGAAFGSKGDLNKEAVAATGAQVLIDTGEYKEGIEEDLDSLQEQLGIPCVFIETKLDEWPAAYRKLGELLGVEDRAEELATYCQDAYDQVSEVMAGIPQAERVRVLYCVGATGTNVLAKGSFQSNVVDMLADNVAVVDSPAGSGAGNESNLEQIAVWDPQVILFGADAFAAGVADDPAWQTLTAIQEGSYHKVPDTPYVWLNNPPTVNQVLGMQWLARVLYPAQFQGKGSAYDVAKSYYKTFYGYDLSQDEYGRLTS